MVADEDIISAFKENKIQLDPELIPRCKELCKIHRLSASDFCNEVEGVMLTNQTSSVTYTLLDTVQKTLDNKNKKQQSGNKNSNTSKSNNSTSRTPKITADKNKTNNNVVYDKNSIAAGVMNAYRVNANNNNKSSRGTPDMEVDSIATPNKFNPIPNNNNNSNRTPSSKNTYAKRENAGKVELKYNAELSQREFSDARPVNLQITILPEDSKPTTQKYMYDKLDNRSYTLEDRFIALRDEIIETNHLGPPQPLDSIHSDPAVFVGRVVCDTEGEGKLNEKSVLLEGSNDELVPLILKDVESYALFPGQIIAVRGVNNRNGIVVKGKDNIFLGALPKANEDGPTAMDADDNNDNARNISAAPVRMIVAAGPFTLNDNVEYEPLTDLINIVKREKPDIFLVIGPFVDSQHPIIESDSLDISYDELFQTAVIEKLKSVHATVPQTRFIIMPSLRDVHHHYVFPQPPFDKANLMMGNVECLPNPATFVVNNDISIGVTSNDVLFQLSTQEIARGKGQTDRLGRLAEHLILQQSYYPQFLPSADVPLDYSLSSALSIPKHDKMPSILLLPSRFPHFVKELTCGPPVLCINPGRLCLGDGGGCYAKITVYPKEVSNAVAKRTQVEIVRI